MAVDWRGAVGFFQEQPALPLEQHLGGLRRRHVVRALFGAQLGARYYVDYVDNFVRVLAAVIFGGMGGLCVAYAQKYKKCRHFYPNTRT